MGQKKEDGIGGSGVAEMFYAFGYKFYYWPRYKNNEEIDRDYNGGGDTFGVWFVAKKYESMKEEIANAGEAVMAMNMQIESGEEWMVTEYVKGMKSDGVFYYDIPGDTPISLLHLLSLLFYCNFTSLCTFFSATFRKLTANETDEQLRERNAEVREFARLLVECAHCFGTKLNDSTIQIFYHGISIVMQFPSAVARFCSPTSTTVAFTVAINFAKNGMILELENNRSGWLKFFDCSVLSEFSNEDERLFIQGGYDPSFGRLSRTGLSFHSIRLLHLNHNYKTYVSVISRLQRFIENAVVEQPFATPKEQQKQKRCFDFILNEKMNNGYNGDGRNEVPVYVRKMVDRVEVGEQKRANADGNCITIEMPW